MLRILSCLLLSAAVLALAAAQQPWKSTDAAQWTSRDVSRILNDSPWAQSTGATFALAQDNTPPPSPTIESPQAGMPSPHNASTDGRWDGGVGRVNRNGPPSLNVTVRWESALPVRLALKRTEIPSPFTPEQLQKDYIITIEGLVPAGRYGPAQLDERSGDSLDVTNPEQMLEGVLRYSRLYPRGKHPILPEDAKLDNKTGVLRIFFPRKDPLSLKDKEVAFETRFGSLSILKPFRLKDMVFQGNLEL